MIHFQQMVNFTSDFWVLICFIFFIILTSKAIYVRINHFFKLKENDIQLTLKNSEDIFKKAKANLEEVQKLMGEIEDAKKIVFGKEQMEMEYDIQNKENKLNRLLEVKKSQFKTLVKSEMTKFKNESLKLLFNESKEKSNKLIDQDKTLYKKFTDTAIERSKS